MEQRKSHFNSWAEFDKYRKSEYKKIQRLQKIATNAKEDFEQWSFDVVLNLLSRGIKKKKSDQMVDGYKLKITALKLTKSKKNFNHKIYNY